MKSAMINLILTVQEKSKLAGEILADFGGFLVTPPNH